MTSITLRVIRSQTRRQTTTASAASSWDVLVLGCGITGAAAYRELRKLCPGWHIILWEKAREAGGRMNTARTRRVPGAQVDLGAEYLSPNPSRADPLIYTSLEEAGVIVALPQAFIRGDKYSKPSQKHFAAPAGMSSIVQFMLQPALTNGAVTFSRRAVSIDRFFADTDGSRPSCVRWRVTDADGGSDVFDAIIATIPIPQLLGTHASGLSSECDLVKRLVRGQHPDVASLLDQVR